MNSLIPARFGLRAKLLTGAAVLLAFTAVIGVLGLRALGQANASAKKMYVSSVEPLAELGTARAKFNENRAFTNNHILETARADKAELESKIDANNAVVDKNLVAVEKSLATDEGKRMFASLRTHLKDYREGRAQVLALSNAGKPAEAYAVNKRVVVPAVGEAAKMFAELFDSKVSLAESEHVAIEASAASSRKRSLLLLGAALIIGFAMAFWFARRIQQTVKQILDRIQTAARARHHRPAQRARRRRHG